MTISFVETMRGTLAWNGGEVPIEFEVKAQAASTRGFLRDGHTELTGLLRAPGLAREAVAQGTLDLSPSQLVYRVNFRSDDGQSLTLVGTKHPSLFRPLSSMTEMPIELRKGEELLASGTMRFDLADLRGFLKSWVPFGRHAQRDLDARRRWVERALLDAP